jgi:hypothetical protein
MIEFLLLSGLVVTIVLVKRFDDFFKHLDL